MAVDIFGLKSGDRIYRWWDAGIKMDIQPLTVVRVNRLTITVDTDQGSRFRLPHSEVQGRYLYDEA